MPPHLKAPPPSLKSGEDRGKAMEGLSLEDYRRGIEEFRRRKDRMLASDPDSPIPPGERAGFQGLRYFPVDPKYRIRVRLQPEASPARVRMVTSKGTEQEFLRVGHFDFSLEGRPLRLFAYRSAPPPGHERQAREEPLFIPFRDATSGRESYGAARYLDLQPSPTGEYILDFNLAYNPYCAYSDDYICPLPPPENTLPVAVRAGERAYRTA